jgi:hypothetical protein
MLEVTYDAVQMQQKQTSPVVQLRFPVEKQGDVIAVTQPVLADAGFEIVKAEQVAGALKNPYIKSVKVQLDPTKRSQALLTCELVRPSARSAPPNYLVQLQLLQQRQSAPVVKTMDPVAVNLTTPGSTTVPLPALPPDWIARNRKMTLTLQQDAKQYAWKDNNMPHNVAVQMSATAQFMVNTVEQNGQLRIDMQALKNPLNIFGN